MCPSGRRHRSAEQALRPAFDVLDSDRDGKISRDDLKTFFFSSSPSSSSAAAAPISDEEIGHMISAADADRDGLVEFEEFERVLAPRSRRGGDVMAEAFRFMDRDGDGKVGFGDLKAYLQMAGLPAGDEDVRAMIRMGDGDGDGGEGVSFDALLRILAVDFADGLCD